MNPFEKHPGIRLNGKLYSKDNLASQKIDNSRSGDNLAQALDFSKQLFSDIGTIAVKTSGSTGVPKEFHFSKAALAISAAATNKFFNLGLDSKAVLNLPMRYIAGKMMVARAILGGYDLIVLEASSNPDLSSITADFMPVTPFQMHSLIANQKHVLRNIGTFLIGGGEPTKDLISAVNEEQINAFSSFGMTETLSHFALANLSQATDSPLYTPLEGVKIKSGSDDRLLVNWPGITKGWLNTNDLVQIEKNKFGWLGRADNLINSGGVKIIPERVESILQSTIPTDFFVAGIEHKTLGEEVVLFTESAIKINLDDYAWDFNHQKPRRVELIKPFLRTISGKIKRQATINSWLKTTN